MFALRRDLPTVVGHCLHDTTLWDRLSLDLLPEAGRIIISSRRAATTPRRGFPDRRVEGPPHICRIATRRRLFAARCQRANSARLAAGTVPPCFRRLLRVTLADALPNKPGRWSGLAAQPLPSKSSLAMLAAMRRASSR